jgi:hypothetical protein
MLPRRFALSFRVGQSGRSPRVAFWTMPSRSCRASGNPSNLPMGKLPSSLDRCVGHPTLRGARRIGEQRHRDLMLKHLFERRGERKRDGDRVRVRQNLRLEVHGACDSSARQLAQATIRWPAGCTTSRRRRVTSHEPDNTRTNPTAVQIVTYSPSTNTPARMATAGLT